MASLLWIKELYFLLVLLLILLSLQWLLSRGQQVILKIGTTFRIKLICDKVTDV